MSLEILEINSTFYAIGTLTKATVKYFKKYFKEKLLLGKSCIIDIDSISEIDEEGILLLKKMVKSSTNSKNDFYLIGHKSKEIYSQTNNI